MILFISAYPDLDTDTGALQRVAALDVAFGGYSRAYLCISRRHYMSPQWEEVSPGVTVHRVNLFLHFWFILCLASRASVLYVHTLDNARLVLPLYLHFPIVTDLWDAVPAEGGLGRRLLESLIVRRSKALVTDRPATADLWRERHGHSAMRLFSVPNGTFGSEARGLASFVTKGEPDSTLGSGASQ